MSDNTIVPGDWIIRNGPKEEPMAAFEGMNPYQVHRAEVDTAFTDHAVFALDITPTHLTIYDPYPGRPHIIQKSLLEGEWHLATEAQVAITWAMTVIIRPKEALYSIQAEKEKYPFHRGAP